MPDHTLDPNTTAAATTPQQDFLSMLFNRVQPTQGQLRQQGVLRTAAGLTDIISGAVGQRRAEKDIERFGEEADILSDQFKDLSAPSLTDPNTIAAATRNAAILGGIPQMPDQSEELAAAKMAMEAGADPAIIQRQLAGSLQAERDRAGQTQQDVFGQSLNMAQIDAQNKFAQEREALAMEIQQNQAALEAAQRESLMAQQQKRSGIQSGITGALQFASNFNPALGGAKFGSKLVKNIFSRAEEGMKVQKTPGEFDHDTNDMILMAQTEDGLVDTGIRQTGGEFVLNPEQAEGLEEAYDNVDREDPTYDQLLALYEAARFLDEPQFDDDYSA